PLGLLLQLLFPFRALANLRGNLHWLRLGLGLADVLRVNFVGGAVTLGLALLFTLQHAAVNQPPTLCADERRRHSALAGNLAVRPPRPLRVFQKRLDSASLVLQRTIAAVRFVCTDRIKDRGPLRTLAVDRF